MRTERKKEHPNLGHFGYYSLANTAQKDLFLPGRHEPKDFMLAKARVP